ncbi:MAG: hypothetical protein SOY60_03100 [Fusobacterium gastrosuis]|uniref:hypothetical protein n=1 Tax=Fusobacterium gastrosuis TaxID=1755100 RepID=UPI001F4F24CE|nr:hypothetical protein [Fusobacterium gastrosuis]MDD7391640.1 hypothetical protein [Fusobacteriaceae bacterium]MDY4010636.1 hypothetical protein [Fusobacterium gastrosuis]MDY5305713.1 hypothetical protein [Fusobacterium gastrosuis]MDY5794771.1 hypothetical protein [Fusobacterium gastrosuis]
MRYQKDNFLNELEGIFNAKTLEEASNIVFSFSTLTLGSNGDKELGRILMETYLHSLLELEFIPKTLILYSEAVLLALANSNVNRYLKNLQNKGVNILICSTSARYYQIENKINVGKLASMKTILEKKMAATKIISL